MNDTPSYPKGYLPHLKLCDDILRHLDTPDMAWSNLDETQLAEPDTQVFSCLEKLSNDKYINRESKNSRRSKITIMGSKFIGGDGYLNKLRNTPPEKNRENLLLGMSPKVLKEGVAYTLIAALIVWLAAMAGNKIINAIHGETNNKPDTASHHTTNKDPTVR